MEEIKMKLKLNWDTLEEAVAYFESLASDLKVLQKLSDPPTDLFLKIEKVCGENEIWLEHL